MPHRFAHNNYSAQPRRLVFPSLEPGRIRNVGRIERRAARRQKKIIPANRAYGNRHVAAAPQSIAMNREHSKPTHVFRGGSRGWVCAREYTGNGGRLLPQGGKEKANQRETWSGTILKPDAFAPRPRCNELRERDRINCFFSPRRRLFFRAPGLIEKQRLQFCKIPHLRQGCCCCCLLAGLMLARACSASCRALGCAISRINEISSKWENDLRP